MSRAVPMFLLAAGLVLLSALGLFLGPNVSWNLLDPRDLPSFLRTAFLVLLVGGLLGTAFRFSLKRRNRWDEFAFILVLACGVNFLVQLSGGLRSPWQGLYFILVGLATLVFPLRLVLPFVGIILGLETSNWLFHRVGTLEDLLRLALLIMASVVGFGLMERAERRRARKAEEELRRLNLGLQQMAGEEEGGRMSPLSDEGKRLGRVEYVRELDRRLHSLLEIITHATQARNAVLLQVEESGESFVARLAVSRVSVPAIDSHPFKSALVAGVVRENRPLSMREKERPLPSFPWYAKQPELHALLAVPVQHESRPRWILILDHEDPDHFDGARRRLAEGFTQQIAQWESSLRQIAELDILSGEFRRLYEASAGLSHALRVDEILQQILSFCREVSRFETCAICLAEEGEETFHVAIAEGYPERIRGTAFSLEAATWAAWLLRAGDQPLAIRFQRRTGMPVLYPGERTASGASFLGVPLQAKNRVSGALLMTRRGEAFSANDVRILRILCNQAAVAIENALVYERLERMAATDPLTALFNRRYFEQALRRELARADRSENKLALLILDIDHFKQLNDTYGHTMGDLILKKLAQVLQSALREGDVVARYGGEEFVILLPAASHEGAQESAERVRRAVASASMHPGTTRKKVTVSIGWALFPDDAKNAGKLLELADKALYFAKDTGRNRVAGYHLLKAEVGY